MSVQSSLSTSVSLTASQSVPCAPSPVSLEISNQERRLGGALWMTPLYAQPALPPRGWTSIDAGAHTAAQWDDLAERRERCSLCGEYTSDMYHHRDFDCTEVLS